MKLTAGTEAQAYGVLLDPSIDTAAPFTDGTVTGSIAKAGSSADRLDCPCEC